MQLLRKTKNYTKYREFLTILFARLFFYGKINAGGAFMNEFSEQELVRREKLNEIRNYCNPYPENFERTHTLKEVRELEDGVKDVKIAGRIVFMRKMGKLSFARIRDLEASMQLEVKIDTIGEENYNFFKKLIDIGDFIGAEGEIFTTQTGEKTLRVHKLTFLGKALRPLPEKFHGLTDIDQKYRQRYVDIIMNEDSRRIFLGRSKLYAFLHKYLGENGISAYGVLMYVQFIFIAIFVGYSIGCAPVVSFHFGAGNHSELQSLLKKSTRIVGSLSIILTVLALTLANPLAKMFVGYDVELLAITSHAFKIFSFSFLLAGFNIFASSFFTALNNGVISAAISFLRTLIFQTSSVLILPLILSVDGLWGANVAAEIFAFVISLAFLVANRKKYHY